MLNLLTLKIELLLFWSIWISIVFLTNLFSALKRAGILPENWTFASQNDQLIEKAVSIYHPPAWLANGLFAGVVIWQGIAMLFLWNAFRLLLVSWPGGLPAVDTAFAILLGLWAAFIISNEIFLHYENQVTQVLIFIAQLVTLLAIHLL